MELNLFDEALTLCFKGLSVSFVQCVYYLPMGGRLRIPST